MKHIENHIPELSGGDISAILAALPLVTYFDFDDPIQEAATIRVMESVGIKLSRHDVDFSEPEFMFLGFAIGLALDFLSGQFSISGVNPELKTHISRNYFVYSRLLPHFEKAANDIGL